MVEPGVSGAWNRTTKQNRRTEPHLLPASCTLPPAANCCCCCCPPTPLPMTEPRAPSFDSDRQKSADTDLEMDSADAVKFSNPLSDATTSLVDEAQRERFMQDLLADFTPEQAKTLAGAVNNLVQSHINTVHEQIDQSSKDTVDAIHRKPDNWYHATAYYAVNDRQSKSKTSKTRQFLTAMSWLMLLAQCATNAALLAGTFVPACTSNFQCYVEGTYCTGPDTPVDQNRCMYCGGEEPSDAPHGIAETGGGPWMIAIQTDPDGTRWNRGVDTFAGYNMTAVKEYCTHPTECGIACQNWCDGCLRTPDPRAFWDAEAGDQIFDRSSVDAVEVIDFVQYEDLSNNNIKAMGPFDWLALLLCSMLVGLKIVSEIKDIKLCLLVMEHSKALGTNATCWEVAVRIHCGIRRYCFLPGLVATIPSLVMLKGADALSICLNSIAVLFITDVDNAIYDYMISDTVKSEVETFGVVVLTTAESRFLYRTNRRHTLLIAIAVMLTVYVASDNAALLILTFIMPFTFFLIGAMLEAEEGQTLQDKAMLVFYILAQGFGGITLYFILFLLSVAFSG